MKFPVEKMCKVMRVSSSGYYKWTCKTPSKCEERRQMLTKEIKTIYEKSKRRYGSPRITVELNKKGITASQPFVAKLMRIEKIKSIIKTKFKATTDSSHNYPVAENKLMQNFEVARCNEVWVSDITYIPTTEGWVYLTTVIDLFDRKVIGWALSDRMYARQTTVPAFKMALLNRPVNKEMKLIFHSDRGVQYACSDFVNEINKQPNIERSMSRKGNCWDNAVAESFFKTLKVELVYQNRYATRKDAELSIFEYIEVDYNQNRRHKHLNQLTITEFNQSINNLTNAA